MDFGTVRSFFFDPLYLRILVVTLILFVAMFVMYFAYMQLSKRDLFHMKKPEGKNASRSDYVLYGLKYAFLFPFLTYFWFLLFVLCMHALTAAEPRTIMFLCIVLVSAIRIAAYVHEHMAEDLAKMVPLALLAAILIDPSLSAVKLDPSGLLILRDQFRGFAKYLLFIIVLEFLLRAGHGLYRKLHPSSS